MARIPFPKSNELDPKTKEFYENIPIKLNMALMACHSPALIKEFLSLGSAILLKSKTPPELRELMILRVGALTNTKYELDHHLKIAKRTGVDSKLIEAAVTTTGDFNPDTRKEVLTIFRLADETFSNGSASQDLVDEAVDIFGNEVTVELILICGYYLMVSQYLKSLDIDLDTV